LPTARSSFRSLRVSLAVSRRRAEDEDHCIAEFERLFEHEYTGAWNPKTGRAEFGAFFVEAVQGPAAT